MGVMTSASSVQTPMGANTYLSPLQSPVSLLMQNSIPLSYYSDGTPRPENLRKYDLYPKAKAAKTD